MVREILVVMEDSDNFDVPPSDIYDAIPTRDMKEIAWHVNLMAQAGLITVDETEFDSFDGTEVGIESMRISWKGYDFLAEATNPKIWEGAKKRAGDAFYGLSLGTLQVLLNHVAKQVLNLP